MRGVGSAVLAAVLVLAGCGAGADPPGTGRDIFEQRAQQVVTAWTDGAFLVRWRASFVAAQDLTLEPSWDPRPNLKAAFLGGWVRTSTSLPTTGGTGTVRYAVDGTTARVRTLSAQAAYDAMVNPTAGACPTPDQGSADCDWVTVTAARPGMATMSTARGDASVPTWQFTVEGLTTPLVRVAVADASETGDFEPDLGAPPTAGRLKLLSAQDIAGADGTRLTVGLGSGSCDGELTPRVRETADVVVVGGTTEGPEEGRACDSMLRIDDVTFELTSPVGARPVLDASSGRPLLPRFLPRP